MYPLNTNTKMDGGLHHAPPVPLPPIQFFPDVRINGKTLPSPTAKAVIQGICAQTKGTKPAACSAEALALT